MTRSKCSLKIIFVLHIISSYPSGFFAILVSFSYVVSTIPLQGKEVKMNFDHGTTTLGFKYQVANVNKDKHF